MLIPNLTEINNKDLKKEIFNLLLIFDDDYMEDKIGEVEVYKLFYHNMCSTKQKDSELPEDYELYDCSKETSKSYGVVTNKFLLYLIKQQLEEELEILKQFNDEEDNREVILPTSDEGD